MPVWKALPTQAAEDAGPNHGTWRIKHAPRFATRSAPRYNPRSEVIAPKPPMGSRALLKLLFLIFIVGFVLGLLSVVLGKLENGSRAGDTPTPPAGLGQTTLLILGVDRFDQTPVLRAVWFVTFRPPGRSVFLYGLPTDAPIRDQEPVTLGALFSWSSDQGVDPLFLAQLAAIVPLLPDVTVLMDETAFGALVDHVGGVDLNGTLFSGNEVLGFLSLVVDEPEATLASQSRLIEALVLRLPELGDAPDVSPLQGLVPDHAHLSLPVSQLLGLLTPLLPVDPSQVHVSRWTGAAKP